MGKWCDINFGDTFYVKNSLTPRILIGVDKIYVVYRINGKLTVDLQKNIIQILCGNPTIKKEEK